MAGSGGPLVITDDLRRNIFAVNFECGGERFGPGTAFLLPKKYQYNGSRVLLTCRHCVKGTHDPQGVKIYGYDDVSGTFCREFEAGHNFFDAARQDRFAPVPPGVIDADRDLDLAVLFFKTKPAGLDLDALAGLDFGNDMQQNTAAFTCGFGNKHFQFTRFQVSSFQRWTEVDSQALIDVDYDTTVKIPGGHSGGPVFDDQAFRNGDLSVRGIVRREQRVHVSSVVQRYLQDAGVVVP